VSLSEVWAISKLRSFRLHDIVTDSVGIADYECFVNF
jgi:hypothetical protein